MSAPRRRGVLRKLGLSIATLAAVALVVEVGTRVVLRVAGRPYDGAEMRASLAEMRSRVADAVPLPGEVAGAPRNEETPEEIVHPYAGYDITSSPAQVSHQVRASRRADPARLRLLVLGGSVAAIFSDLGQARLRALLEADPALGGRTLEVWSLARGAYKQPQLYLYLSYVLSLGVRPDVVLSLDGFNEVAIAASNAERGMHPTYPSYDQWLSLVHTPSDRDELMDRYVVLRVRRDALQAAIEAVIDRPLYGSAAFGALAYRWCRSREVDYTRASAAYMERMFDVSLEPAMLGPAFEQETQAAVRTSVECWFQSSLLIDQLCDGLGIAYVHVLQPTLNDPGAKPKTPEEQDKGRTRDDWLAGVEAGYPLLRTGGEQLAARGVRFLDASRLFAAVEETLYYDECHFVGAGNELLAEAIAPVVLAALAEER